MKLKKYEVYDLEGGRGRGRRAIAITQVTGEEVERGGRSKRLARRCAKAAAKEMDRRAREAAAQIAVQTVVEAV